MKVKLIVVGKTNQDYLKEGIAQYLKRLKHYIPFDMVVVQDVKNAKNKSEAQLKEEEGRLILNQLDAGTVLILMDEKGKEFTSTGWANYFQQHMNRGVRSLTFVIGGAYGFSEEVYQQAQGKVALSKMTFSHQMVRLFFVEQVYRAMTILKGQPYHHQ